jgi:hypothetical protein
MDKLTLATMGLLLVGLLGCSSDSKSEPNGAGAQRGTCPAFTDLCSKVTAQNFATACGTTTTSGVSTDHVATDPNDPADVSSCQYDIGSSERLCFPDGPAAAQAFYDNERKPEGGQTTEEDLTAVGDKAFYRETIVINEAFVYALKGQIMVDVQYGGVATAGAAKACLIDLANQVLSAESYLKPTVGNQRVQCPASGLNLTAARPSRQINGSEKSIVSGPARPENSNE